MPPRGRPYKYGREKIYQEVPEISGVYWLWSFGELVRIGQSKNLRRRILEYSRKNPNKFRYQTVDKYFQRRDAITRPPRFRLNGGTVLDKIEHTEFEWYKRKYGDLPRWNSYDKHYDVGVFEQLLSRIL